MSAEPRVSDPAAEPASLWEWMRFPWQSTCLAGGLLYWLIGGLFGNSIAWVLLPILPRETGRRVGCRLIGTAFRSFCAYLHWTRLVHVDLSSLSRLRGTRKSFILAPNHTALWDAVFLMTCLPAPLCIMKTAILRNPLLGGCARLAGHIPNSDKKGMIRAAVSGLQAGRQLILFPEGTRTRHHQRWINPFKGGIAIIARRADVPVYPVFIRSNTRYMEKNWPPWKPPAFPIRISIELGEPVQPVPGESSQHFVARLQSLFEGELSRPHPLRRQSAADSAP